MGKELEQYYSSGDDFKQVSEEMTVSFELDV